MLYHGDVGIDFWEYLGAIFYLSVLYVYFARIKRLRIKAAPEYAYLLWGLFAKVIGGTVFALIYFYYYKGGDTMSYFYSAVSMSKLAVKDPMGYLTVLFGENSWDKRDFFDSETGWPYRYVFLDHRTFFVIRFVSVLALITFNSYLITTVLLATWSYIGIWRCYLTFVSYYPNLRAPLATAFLFMPSVVFWGSGILKDTITLSATCVWVHCFDEVFFKKRKRIGKGIGLFLSGAMLVIVKPYIFMVLMPCTMLWLAMVHVQRLRNGVLRAAFLPAAVMLMLAISAGLIKVLGDRLDKFAPDEALNTVMVTQSDMVRSEQYGSGYFDVGPMDGTWSSVLSKFPIALNAALYRPYLWESQSLVMSIGALENLFLMAFTILVVVRSGPLHVLRMIRTVPIVQFCIVFIVIFGFVIGITTPNFGALVRFKIPLVPFFVSGLYIMRFLSAERKKVPFGRTRYRTAMPEAVVRA